MTASRTVAARPRWPRRELRRRVDALHRQRERVSPADWSRDAHLHPHPHPHPHDELHDDLRTAPPLTLAFEVAQELRRRGRSSIVDSKMSEQMRVKALQEALTGLEKVVVRDADLRAALTAGGIPCTIEELKARFDAFIAALTKGKDAKKTRVVVE